MTTLHHDRIILASQSPRRKELLETAGLDFDILAADINEEAVPFQGDPGAYAQTLSRLKAQAIAGTEPDAWIIGADTIVVSGETILGKPKSRSHALSMLTALNNDTHSVFTGYTIIRQDQGVSVSCSVETRVTFKAMRPEEIAWYADTDEPYDKAGAYGIQGIGAFMVKEIQGSYSNVVGLPVCEIIDTLMTLNVIKF